MGQLSHVDASSKGYLLPANINIVSYGVTLDLLDSSAKPIARSRVPLINSEAFRPGIGGQSTDQIAILSC
jgi:hypothetical protein